MVGCNRDENGDEMFNRAYGGEDVEFCRSIIQTTNGGYALVGYTESFGAGEEDIWLVVTDEDGEPLWERTYGGESEDWCYGVIQLDNGGFLLAGSTESFTEGTRDFWLVFTDEDGVQESTRTYGGLSTRDSFRSIIQTSDGGYALIGGAWEINDRTYNPYIVKTDSEGEPVWSQIYRSDLGAEPWSIKQMTDNGYVLAGSTSRYGDGGGDY